ncbi:hypothetical protein T458_06160 [Brevibacillus panacihumi W25]|uniref:Uncharacterized protein n=1 Tax=Brevibacillus panacihumi W25 TaxID=1408254 RepID=V6MAS5_9BACL|nr:hypothetical protein [Brevibacillus panacihumi]EST55656.1 hypothetical protein T458_06160 [Brevibacillus panacihumi W25]
MKNQVNNRIQAKAFGVQHPVVVPKVGQEAMRDQDLAMGSLMKFVDQYLVEEKMKANYLVEMFDDFHDEDLNEAFNEAVQYFHRNYRPFIEVHFMDYKGQPVDQLTSEQRLVMIAELQQALKELPLVPLTLMYDPESLTAVWEIPEARRFLSEQEFYKMRDNFLKMLISIDFSTPVPTEDYYDSELRYHSIPMIKLYHDYQNKIKPLQDFDQICGIEVCVR